MTVRLTSRVSVLSLFREVGGVAPCYIAVQTIAGLAPAGFVLLIAAAVGPDPLPVPLLGLWLAIILAVASVTDAVSPGLRAQVLDRSRITLEHHWIQEVAHWPDLGVFERPDLVRSRTEAERAVPELVSAVVFLGFIGLSVASIAPVAGTALRLNPVLTVAVIVGGLPLAIGTTRLYRQAWDVRTVRLSTVLKADGLKEAATDARSAKDIRAYAMQDWTTRRWLHLQRGLLSEIGAVRLRVTRRVVIWAVCGTLVVIAALFFTLPAATTPQELALLIGLLLQVTSSLGLFIQAVIDIGEMRRPFGRYLGFVNAARSGEVGTPSTGRNHLVGVSHVTFAYGVDAAPVLRDFSLSFVEGGLNVVVGPNGAGKSTFIKVLTGLYKPQVGAVSLGTSGGIAVMHQDFARFSLTVRENLAAGAKRSDDELWTILEKVGLSQLVSGLSDGLDTPLYRDATDQATDLSGGQWQRLALARLLVHARSSSVVLLDEPTSALDALAEADVLEMLVDELRGKTVVLVTHRLQWAVRAEQVIQVGQRESRARSHQALLVESAWYRDAYERQSSAFVERSVPEV